MDPIEAPPPVAAAAVGRRGTVIRNAVLAMSETVVAQCGVTLWVAGLLVACSQSPPEPAPAKTRTPAAAVGARTTPLSPAQFRIATLPTGEGVRRYIARTDDAAGACWFELVLGSSDQTSEAPFSIVEVSLRRQPGTDCTAFLGRLSQELGYAGRLPSPSPVDGIAGTIAIFSTDQSRRTRADGRPDYSSSPPGGWMTGKLFLARGRGEVFLDMSPRDGVGEFSIKDADYATTVVTELGRVLLPRGGR